MLGQLGYKVNPDAFNNSSYWQNVVAQINTQLPGTVDGVHLQALRGRRRQQSLCRVGLWRCSRLAGIVGLERHPQSGAEHHDRLEHAVRHQRRFHGWLYDDFVGERPGRAVRRGDQ